MDACSVWQPDALATVELFANLLESRDAAGGKGRNGSGGWMKNRQPDLDSALSIPMLWSSGHMARIEVVMGRVVLGLLALFFVEMIVLIKVGAVLGAIPTLVLMVVSALIGGQLVRSQGLNALLRLQPRLQAGEVTPQELLQGLWLPVAGFLFIFPGFVSDVLALLLLQPAIRRGLTVRLLGWGTRVFSRYTGRPLDRDNGGPFAETPRSGTTVDGEYERKDHHDDQRLP